MKNLLKSLLVAGVLAFGASTFATAPAMALVEIDVNKGNIEPLPVAITDFVSGDTMGTDIAGVVAADLATQFPIGTRLRSRRPTMAVRSVHRGSPRRPVSVHA